MKRLPDNTYIEHAISVAGRCLEGKVSIRIGTDGEVTLRGIARPNPAKAKYIPKDSKVERRILELLRREKKSFTSATIARKLGYRNNPSYLRQVLKEMVNTGKIAWTQEDGYSWKEPAKPDEDDEDKEEDDEDDNEEDDS